MRPQEDLPRRRRPERRTGQPGRGRVVMVVIAILLFLLITSLNGIAGFYTDFLWFHSLHLTSVWRTVLGAKTALTLIFMAFFFALAWVNLYLADRMAPKFPPTGPQEELVERYHELVGPHTGLVRSGVSLMFALIVGASAAGRWNDWLLFIHSVSFHQKDATFHQDISFYVFKLPFYTFVVGWLFNAVLVVFLITVAAHYLNGGIRTQSAIQRVTPQVKAHLSVLLGILSLIKALQYWFNRYQLTYSQRGTVNGATYTDTHVQVKVLQLLIIISLFAFVLFIVNIRRRGWVLPALAVGLWAFVAIVVGGLVPAFVQRFRVQPSESSMEAPYITQNINATRLGLNIGEVKRVPFLANGKLDSARLNDNAGTVRNIRLWDPAPDILQQTFQQLQGLRPYYAINNVDVDRYPLDSGTNTQVMVSGRDLKTSGVPQKSWEAEHLLYTHGYGVVMAPANAKTPAGQPKLVVSDIPVNTSPGAPKITQPRIYIGEQQSPYVLVNTKQPEIDYQGQALQKTQPYEGADGITLGDGVVGFLRRAAFSIRFGDINPLISSNVTAKSKILMQRSVTERLKTLAPFLAFDHDPYIVVDSAGKLNWIVDAYTTTDQYPNAQLADTTGVDNDSGLHNRSFNYIRNSVKAVVDAYNGTVKFYVVDNNDPLIKGYRQAFPSLFTDGDKVPADIRAHFRYPEDLFTVQTTMWGRYHITNPGDFYNKADQWNIATNPPASAADALTQTTSPDTAAGAGATVANRNTTDSNKTPIPAYYQLMRLPNEDTESFLILRPFVSTGDNSNSKVLRAFMVAKSDPNDYGRLESFQVPSGNATPGPEIAASNMQSDTNVSQKQTLLGKTGSEALFGNLLMVPIDQTILFVRPFYVQAQTDNRVPTLQYVIVGYQDSGGSFRVSIQPTLLGALTELFGPSPNTQEETPSTTPPSGSTTPTTSPGGTTTSAAIDKLVTDLNQALADATTALNKGDLGAYQAAVAKAQALSKQLVAARGLNNGTTGTTTTTTAPPGSSTTTTTAPSP